MSLSITTNPDGTLRISCGTDVVTVGAPATPFPPITPGGGGVVIKVAGPDTVRVPVGSTLEDLLAREDFAGREAVSFELNDEESVDVGRVLRMAQEKIGPDVTVALTFRASDDG